MTRRMAFATAVASFLLRVGAQIKLYIGGGAVNICLTAHFPIDSVVIAGYLSTVDRLLSTVDRYGRSCGAKPGGLRLAGAA